MKLVMLVALVMNSPFAVAHHSSVATFTKDRTSTIEGVLTSFRFRNPHVLIYLDVTNEDGSVTNWMSEGASATSWRQAGWEKDTLSPGDTLRISGDATIDGSPMVWIDQIEYLDATSREIVAVLVPNEDPAVSFGRAAATTDAPPAVPITMIPLTLPGGEPNFTGTTRQNNAISPRGGPDKNDAEMPYNDVGKVALAAWDITNDPQVFCDPPGLVRQAGYTMYGQNITQYPDHIVIEYEEYGGRRAIFLDGELPKPGVRSHLGDSVARYEGDALIIETVNLLPNASGHRGRPLSDHAWVTEVYTRADDPKYGSQVKTETTVIDPVYLTEPWTISRIKVYSDGYQFIENECVAPLRERPPNTWQE